MILKGRKLNYKPFRSLSLAEWDVPMLTICSPGQLYPERVQVQEMMLMDDGRIVMVTTPFKNLVKPNAP